MSSSKTNYIRPFARLSFRSVHIIRFRFMNEDSSYIIQDVYTSMDGHKRNLVAQSAPLPLGYEYNSAFNQFRIFPLSLSIN